MAERLLEVQNLKVSFYLNKGSLQVVRGFDLTLNRGEIIGIVGESGSGKTVSASTLIRLIDDDISHVDEGQVIYKGRELLRQKEEMLQTVRGKEIAYIFQNAAASLSPYKTIGRQLKEVLKSHKLPGDEGRIIEALSEVGLTDPDTLLSMYPYQLSGGMNQRVLIAQCILGEPELLIADEPTSAIDTSLQKKVLDLLRKINEKRNMSVILITHDFDVAKYLCSRLVIMYGGLVIEEGSLEAIYDHPLHPYTEALIRCTESLDSDSENLYTLEGSPPSPFDFEDRCPFYERCRKRKDVCLEKIPDMIIKDNRKVRCVLVQETEN